MELTLNLVWVCVAIAGILAQVVVLSRVDTSPKRSASALQKIIAMGCALVILFFVISMTDDLHNQQVLVEERKGSRIMAVMGADAHSEPGHAISTDFLLFFPPEPPPFALAIGKAPIPTGPLFAAVVEGKSLCGRAPPTSLA